MSERWEIRQLGETEFSTIERGTYAKGNFQRLTPAMRYEDAELIEAELDRLQTLASERMEAIDEAMQALYGDGPPDVTTAQMWLRTTFPEDHPNYVSRDHEFFRRHPR